MWYEIPAQTKFRLLPRLAVLAVVLIVLDARGVIHLDLAANAASPPAHRPVAATPSGAARVEIPPHYLRLYREAGAGYGLPWSVLAAIGKVESDHGRSQLPGVHAGSNAAGACGPMQIGCVTGSKAGNSWATYGRGSPYDPGDAIPAAARYLIGHGAHRDLRAAIYGYNHAGWYVERVLAWNHRYSH